MNLFGLRSRHPFRSPVANLQVNGVQPCGHPASEFPLLRKNSPVQDRTVHAGVRPVDRAVADIDTPVWLTSSPIRNWALPCLLALITLLLVVCTVPAQALQFSSGLASSWTFSNAGNRCQLEHDLGGFATARFVGVPGEGVRFELLPTRDLFGAGGVMATAVAPEWHPAWPDARERGLLDHVEGGAVSAAEPLATALLMDLRQGRQIRVTAQAGYGDGEDGVAATVSPVRFANSYGEFLGCQSRTTPTSSSRSAAHTHIPFDSARLVLSASNRERLDRLARDILTDRMLTGIFIDGHADARGTAQANLALSEQRARLVADHLVARGIPRRMLTVRFHGASQPLDNRSMPAADAQNRRVTVRLTRHQPGDTASVASSAR